MPPPSSPQGSHSQPILQPSMIRAPPPPLPPSSAAGRDILNPPSLHRPGSSMSISSMLGADTSRPTHNPTLTTGNSASKVTTISASAWPPTSNATSPPVSDRAGFLSHKSLSPEKPKAPLPQTKPSRAYSGEARRSFSGTKSDFSENSRVGLSPGSLVSRFSPTSDVPSHQGWKPYPEKYSNGRLERPNSQPSGYRTPPREFEDKVNLRPATSETEGFRRAQGGTNNLYNSKTADMTAKEQVVRADSASADYSDHRAQRAKEGPLLRSAQKVSPTQEPTNPTHSFHSRTSAASESQNPRNRSEAELLANRTLEREQFHAGPLSPESLRRLREERLVAASVQQQGPVFGPSNQPPRAEQTDDRPRQMQPRNQPILSIDGPSPTENLDQPGRPEEESPHNHRSSLALLFDHNRRGRISPLPQAVQGAQARLSGPASDPGIKNEFARMFSGIGSGVGKYDKGRQGSGASSPYPASPTRKPDGERRTPFSGRGDIEHSKTRAGSRGGKRGRKSREEEPKQENETDEASNSRGVKRSRQHHHHPHPHIHQ